MISQLLFAAAAAASSAANHTQRRNATVPATMHAYQLPRLVKTFDELVFATIPTPKPANDEILIKVEASSINPIDWKLALVEISPPFNIQFPFTMGFDAAGTVAAVGSECSRLKVGDEVWVELGREQSGQFVTGGYADFAIAKEEQVGLKPQSISMAEAASLPLVALTSYQALTAYTAWSKRPTVFITSGSGGTGFVGLQIAKALGAGKVVTQASGEDAIAFVKAMGADEVVDYRKQNWSSVLAADSVDLVFDNFGEDPAAMMRVLKAPGLLVSITESTAPHPKPGVRQVNVEVNSSSHADLDALSKMVADGQLRPHVAKAFALSDIPAAFNYSQGGRVVGKLAVVAAAAK